MEEDPDGFLRWELELDGNLDGQLPNNSFDPNINPTILNFTPADQHQNSNSIFYTTCDINLIAVDKRGTRSVYSFHLMPIREFVLSEAPTDILEMAFGVAKSFGVYIFIFFIFKIIPNTY